MPDRKTIAVDLDGVLADFSQGWKGVDHIGDPIPGAVEFTRRLAAFSQVLIYSTRCNEEVGRGMKAPLLRNIVRDWLDRHGFTYEEIWIGQGKPIAAAYIDDRAVSCRPQDNTNCPDGNPQAAFELALVFARALCENVPPGCSLSHTTPVLAADSQPSGNPGELEALRDRVETHRALNEQMREAIASATGESDLVCGVAALGDLRARAAKAEARVAELERERDDDHARIALLAAECRAWRAAHEGGALDQAPTLALRLDILAARAATGPLEEKETT